MFISSAVRSSIASYVKDKKAEALAAFKVSRTCYTAKDYPSADHWMKEAKRHVHDIREITKFLNENPA